MRPGDLVRCILSTPIDVTGWEAGRSLRLQPRTLGLVVRTTYGSNYAFILVSDGIIEVDRDFWQVVRSMQISSG